VGATQPGGEKIQIKKIVMALNMMFLHSGIRNSRRVDNSIADIFLKRQEIKEGFGANDKLVKFSIDSRDYYC
jgi:hypothetical protein